MWCLLLFTDSGIAQPYTFRHLGVENGLSNNYVTDIEQDGQGCIWIATESGLSRFDGRNFTVYKKNNSGLISNALNALLYDKDTNTLWIGTKGGLSVFCCFSSRFENYTTHEGIEISGVAYLSHAADTGIWITNHHGGIVYCDKKTRRFTPFAGINIPEMDRPNWCSYDDGKGKLFIGHAQNGLSIVDLKSKTARNFRHDSHNPKSLPGNSVYSICTDHLGNIWIGTNQGLALFNPQTEEFLVFTHEPGNPHSLIADHIYSIKEMDDGMLWIASDIGGISILDLRHISFMDPESVRFLNITSSGGQNGLSSGNIRSLLQDVYGNIWIGNYSSGVDFISHTQPGFHVLPYTTERGNVIKNKPVWGIYADNDGQIWLGSENEIAVFKDNQSTKVCPIASYLGRPYGQVFAIKGDNRGTLLLGIYDDGLLKFNPRNNRVERIRLDMDNIDIITFFEDNDGKMWIGAEYGIYTYTGNEIHIEKAINDQLPDRSVYGILRDRQGKLWVGTYGGGIAVFDRNNRKIAELNEANGFCSNSISHLYLDSHGSVWAATRNGIGYVADTGYPYRFELYNDKHGLKETHVRAIQEDKTGNIWISTNDGISFWNKRKQRFDNYDHRDGIPIGNFIEGSACSTSDGIIYFGSLNGVCYFNPHELVEERRVAPVQIIECKGFNKQTENRKEEFLIVPEDGMIDLPYNQNSFRISFSVPDYSQSRQVEYAYMIEGLENVWYNTQGENQVTFRNLSPGEYKFKVKARLKNRDWDDSHIASMPVRIHPPLWLTWYAKLFYGMVFCLGIFVILRSYKNRLALQSSLELERKNNRNKQELNDERLRFYTNITHELRTPLTLILGPLEDLQNDPGLSAYYSKKINIIHESAIRLLNLINQILEFRKTETQNRKLAVSKGDLASLVAETGLRYKELNQNNKVKIHVHIETEDTKLYFDGDMMAMILDNLLSNAVKYTPEGEIRLTLRSVSENEKRYTEIEVSDTGYGIDEQALPHIFDRYYQAKGKHQASGTGIGLALVKSLSEIHEGTLYVQSKTGTGTTFTFRILTENTYPGALHKEGKIVPFPETGTVNVEMEDDTDVRPVILVVEDNTDIREYIASSLASNYKVVTAANGKDSLDLARKHIPNIIVSDIMMPVMNGIELCRAVKEDVRTSHIPVILLTAKDSIHDKEEGYESGADSYMTKPFSARLLQSRIHNLLESRKKLAQQIAIQTQELKPEDIREPLKLSRLDEEFLARLIHVIEENLNIEKLDIAFMMEKMSMSHSTFYRKVKGLTGMSANEFIRKVRLKNSLRLLLSGTYNVSETAYMTGFNDIAYFRECFKEEYGMSPSEYLRQQKK
ncbi:MAG: two-component regulator propeller domain-containing protein [Breznakibacter sp.]